MYLNDGPRTWKWGVPAALAAACGWSVWALPPEYLKWAVLLMLFAGLFGWMALTNWWRLYTSHKTEMYTERKIAESKTPLVLLAENMKQMHPEAVRVLNRFGVRTSWQVRVSKNFGERDWVLADTNVHFGFIEFVLSRSNGALYPKNKFSEGSRKWDPDAIVEDREQYDELEKWFFARMMVTRSHGDYKPAEFLPPWTPDLILETMGLSGEQDLYRPEEDLKTKDLSQTTASKPANGKGSNASKAEPDLSAAELMAIQEENLAYAEKFQS